MKNLITVFFITLATLAFGNNTPEVIISEGAVTISIVDMSSELFTVAEFDQAENKINFETLEDVNMIQIFGTDGTLEFQLPVMSNKVSISKELFSKGTSQLGFIMTGDPQLQMTEVVIK